MEPIVNVSSMRIREAVRSFVRTRTRDFPISITDLVDRVRYVFADYQATDRELADLIALEIIHAGGNVWFDTNARDTMVKLDGTAVAECRTGTGEAAGLKD